LTRISLQDFLSSLATKWPLTLKLNLSLLDPFSTLIRLVFSSNSKDVDVWATVYELISAASPAWTPPLGGSTTSRTPLRSSIRSKEASGNTGEIVNDQIKEELRGSAFFDVKGFHKFFGISELELNCAVDHTEPCQCSTEKGEGEGFSTPGLPVR
jgi:hypothetical protein